MESLNARDGRWRVLASNANQVNVLIHLDLALLNGSRADSASARNVHGRIDRHQELLVDFSLRHLEGLIHRFYQLFDGVNTELGIFSIEGAESRALDESA